MVARSHRSGLDESHTPTRRAVTLGAQNGLRVEQLPELVRQAEALGYRDAWTEEAVEPTR